MTANLVTKMVELLKSSANTRKMRGVDAAIELVKSNGLKCGCSTARATHSTLQPPSFPSVPAHTCRASITICLTSATVAAVHTHTQTHVL